MNSALESMAVILVPALLYGLTLKAVFKQGLRLKQEGAAAYAWLAAYVVILVAMTSWLATAVSATWPGQPTPLYMTQALKDVGPALTISVLLALYIRELVSATASLLRKAFRRNKSDS